MKKYLPALICIFFFSKLNAQVTADYAVMITASVDTLAPSVTLQWKTNPLATSYSVTRKTKNNLSWTAAATLTASDSFWTDTNVVLDSNYEYRVVRYGGSFASVGYIFVSLKMHATENRGKIILLVDATLADSISNELNRLKWDLIGDGWQVIRHDVLPSDSVPFVRNLIGTDYLADPLNLKSVYIIGHVPVPYSGDINPDGHPDHLGAWPSEGIYGDMSGVYTDISVNDTVASRIENRNVPGDGKFDQSLFSSNIILQIGRVDFHDMPLFPQSEIQLLRNYLNKEHEWRFKNIPTNSRGLIDDNFGAFGGEAFASSAFRSFPPLVKTENVFQTDYVTTLDSIPYLWSYGCGGGWYQGAGGIGSTQDFVNDSIQSIFSMLFGSYFGDWDVQNSFLRAPLASRGTVLSNAWSGRPIWYFHHMAGGETLGYEAKWAMNNNSTYSANYGMRFVHIALMGDPSLRMEAVIPAQNLSHSFSMTPPSVSLHWNPSADSIRGYFVFRSDSSEGIYFRISPLVTDTQWVDSSPLNNDYYMVRAVKLEQNPSGFYYNLSQGIFDSVSNVVGIFSGENAPVTFSIQPNPCDGNFVLKQNLSAANPNGLCTIRNSSGQIVFQTQVTETNKKFLLENFEAGIYSLNLNNGKISQTKKLVIVK